MSDERHSFWIELPFATPLGPWAKQGACRGVDVEMFYPERGEQVQAAVAVCVTCPVRRECLHHALTAPEKIGIWGGTPERRRRVLRKQIKAGALTVDEAVVIVVGDDLEVAS